MTPEARKVLAALGIIAALGISLITWPTDAHATRPTPTLGGYPKCVTTNAGAAKHGWAKTKPGQVCAAKMVGVRKGPNRVDYTRTQPITESWELVAIVWDPDTDLIVANIVRRPA